MADNQLPSKPQQAVILGETKSQKILVAVAIVVVLGATIAVFLTRKKDLPSPPQDTSREQIREEQVKAAEEDAKRLDLKPLTEVQRKEQIRETGKQAEAYKLKPLTDAERAEQVKEAEEQARLLGL